MSDSESRDSFYDDDSYDDIGSERLSEIYDRDSESSVERMGPPPSVPPSEMKLRKEIKGLREEIGYKNAMIDLLKMHNETCKKEKNDLHSKYEVLKQRVADLTGKRVLQGGNNKYIKNVSQRSTSSRHHATRRHASQRKKSGTLRRVQR
jgi:hypothetical protein